MDPVLSVLTGTSYQSSVGMSGRSSQAGQTSPVRGSLSVGNTFEGQVTLSIMGAAVVGLLLFYFWTRDHQG